MKFTEDIMLSYLDGELTDEEVLQFKNELKKNKVFADRFSKFETIHNSLLDNPLASPTDYFVDRVMESIAVFRAKEMKFFNRSRLFVLGVIIMIVATSLYYFAVQFYPSFGGAISDQITLKSFTLNLQPAQEFLSSTLIYKIVLYVNGLICLLLLDRAVLKPYFMRRKQRYSM
jgi:glucan phosphoethanolaminetransferase (alkaline phosphatase superfamily)